VFVITVMQAFGVQHHVALGAFSCSSYEPSRAESVMCSSVSVARRLLA